MKKGKKIIIGMMVLGTFVSACVAVANVNKIKDFFQSIGKNDQERAQDKAHDSDHYKDLTQDEKKDFDNKLKDITDSDYYKNLDKKQKEELVDKFVESEKVEKEVASDPVDKDPEEIQSQISDLKDNLQDIENELNNLKENGASEEEIKEAEQKQQEVEDQIKSAEQEKAYWDTVSTTKESINNCSSFNWFNDNLTIRRINSIFYKGTTLYVNADFVKEENIGGFVYKSKQNQYLRIFINEIISGNESYETILTLLSDNANIESIQVCTNKNLQSHKDYFEKNKNDISVAIRVREQQGYQFEVFDSWEQENDSHPNYLIKATKNDDVKYILITYNKNQNKYSAVDLSKACPEFWNQLEIEQKAQAQEQKKSGAEAAAFEGMKDVGENGEMLGFDYNKYREYQDEKDAKEQQAQQNKIVEETKPLFPDFDLSL